MRPPLPRSVVLFVMAGSLVAAAGLTQAQDTQAPARNQTGSQKNATSRPKGSNPIDRIEGVITKIEKITEGATEGSTVEKQAEEGRELPRSIRLTVNTSVPWRDWVRDQVVPEPEDAAQAQPKAAAGADATRAGDATKADDAAEADDAGVARDDSVATKGHPESPQTLLLVDLAPSTRIEVLYRSATDEVAEGSPTPEGASAGELTSEPAGGSPGEEGKSAQGAPAKKAAERLRPSDLQVNQYVTVEYRHVEAHNRALRVVVLRPVGGPDTPAAEADAPTPGGATSPGTSPAAPATEGGASQETTPSRRSP